MHFLSKNMRIILVPNLFGFAKNFRFPPFAPPTSVHLYCLFNVTSRSYDVTCQSYALNHFKTSYIFLTKLGTFYLVSLWHVLMFGARGLS